jgi:hypothetical protein
MLGDSATYMRFLLLGLLAPGMALGADSVAIVKKAGALVTRANQAWAMTVDCPFAMPRKAN